MKNAERVDLLLYTDHDESVMHYELQGCATDALAKNPEYIQDGMVAEILWGEADRSSEPGILNRVEGIVGVRGTVKDDIPDSELLWHHQFGNLTSAVREVLGDFHPAGVYMLPSVPTYAPILKRLQ